MHSFQIMHLQWRIYYQEAKTMVAWLQQCSTSSGGKIHRVPIQIHFQETCGLSLMQWMGNPDFSFPIREHYWFPESKSLMFTALSYRPMERVLSGVLTRSTAPTWSKPLRSSTSLPHMPSAHHPPPHPGKLSPVTHGGLRLRFVNR